MNSPGKSAPPAAETATPDTVIEPPIERADPPKVYIASCGTLCDVFWWARRRSPDNPS
jgi:hypothetical protein